MQHRLLIFLSTLLWFLLSAQAAAEDTKVVPIDQEPRHRLALERKQVRVFDTRIAPGDTTLFHRHERDSVYVLISGTSNLATEQLGKPPKSITAKPGDVFFGGHATAPLTHRVSNFSGEQHHVLDIELIDSAASSNFALAALPARHIPILANERVRVSRIVLGPGEVFHNDYAAAPGGVLVVLAGSRLGFWPDDVAMQRRQVDPGWFYVRDDSIPLRIHNEGDDRLELINVEIK